MPYEKKQALSPLLESDSQIHITIYLENRDGFADIKNQIQACIAQAQKSLKEAVSATEVKRLLQPIQALVQNTSVLQRLKGSIGLFRTRTGFRVLSIPVKVKSGAHVATSFHVKPLLQWMQWDSAFLLLGLDTDAVHLYLGSQQTLRKIDSTPFSQRVASLLERKGKLSLAEDRELREESLKAFAWLNEWISESVPRPDLKLFVAGRKHLVDRYIEHHDYKRTIRTPIAQFFTEERALEVVEKLRAILKNQTRKSLEQALYAFRVADEMNVAKSNIREIARAAVNGKVKKLMIAENRSVYGKLNLRTGEVLIHPFDLDHEDDDLLDDLAQRVLLSGGEVFVAKKEEIPNGRSLLAIFEEEPSTRIERTKEVV